MDTTVKEIKVSVSEIARTLGWSYTTANSIRERKSPESRYQKYLECEKKLKEAKMKVAEELTKN